MKIREKKLHCMYGGGKFRISWDVDTDLVFQWLRHRVKSIPGTQWSMSERCWLVPGTLDNYRIIGGICGYFWTRPTMPDGSPIPDNLWYMSGRVMRFKSDVPGVRILVVPKLMSVSATS